MSTVTEIAAEDSKEKYATDIDLFTEESLRDPYPDYKSLRDVGRAAFLRKQGVWIVTRYDEVKRNCSDWKSFSSAKGLALNPTLNEAWKDWAPLKDGAEHARMRQPMMQTIGPKAVAEYREYIHQTAAELVTEVISKGEINGVTEMAQMMPIRAFLYVLGVEPDLETCYDMIHWATDTYNCSGPVGTFEDSVPSMDKLYGWAQDNVTRENTRPGSVAALTWEAVDRGEMTEVDAKATFAAYVTAGLDTTGASIGNTLNQFAENPDQWRKLTEDPSLASAAVMEGVRIDTVAHWWSRVTTTDVELDDIYIPKGSRVMHSYAAANRDERHYEDPDRFLIERNPTDHLAFGFGPHMCIGKNLSNLEMIALWTEMSKRVDRIEPTGVPVRNINNLIHSFQSVPVRIYPK